jgi:diphthamide biosynthesis protein 4
MATKNFYEILEVDPGSSIDQIKKSYQRLVLQHHPDKNGAFATDNQSFQLIDEAWKVLRSVESRKIYDAELFQQDYEENPIIHESLGADEFQFEAEIDSYCHSCRCGGKYILPEFEGDECLISCDECSLVIEVLKTGVT